MEQLCDCGDDIALGRVKLGYRTCLSCGEASARNEKFCVVNMHKSNYVVVSDPADLKRLNKYDNS